MRHLYEDDNRAKTFTLPVSGSVTLFGPEVDVVRTPQFQRLGGIKQLGTSYVVFRGALHTRFEHSLGALHEAERMVRSINENPRSDERVDRDAHKLARLGALLHDLTHVPFGHTLEDEFHLLNRHDTNQPRFDALLKDTELSEVLRRGLGPELFEELLRTLLAKSDEDFAELRYPFVGDIVGNTVCADLLDYVKRDLAACGLPVALGERFLDYLTLTTGAEVRDVDSRRVVLNLDKRNMPRPDTESEVLKLLNYRYELAERVYFHHAKNAASCMIARAVQEAGYACGSDTPDENDHMFLALSDEMLLLALADPVVAEAFGLRAIPGREGDRSVAAQLAADVLRRELFKIAYIGVHDDLALRAAALCEQLSTPEERRTFENRIATAIDLPAGAVLLHIPRRKMMTKAAEVRVRTSQGDVLKMSEWDSHHSRRVSALNDAHERLWRVTVFIDPRYADRSADVRLFVEDEFKAPSRYVEPRASRLLHELFDRFAEEEGWVPQDRRVLDDVVASELDGDSTQSLRDLLRIKIRLARQQRGID